MPDTTTPNYRALLEQRALLEAQIKAARETELATVISQIKALVAEYDIKSEDIFDAPKTRKSVKSVAPKYKDPVSGKTWTGRGKPPTWTKGLNLDDCRIAA